MIMIENKSDNIYGAVFVIFLLIGLVFPIFKIASAKEILTNPVDAHLVRTIDGDTIEVQAYPWLGIAVTTKVRLDGVDTPEIRGKCASERGAAQVAKIFVDKMLKGKTIKLYNARYGKWAGRIVATVVVDGKNIAEVLVREGYGRVYVGGKREGWCK